MGSRKDFNLFPRQNLQWQRLPVNIENDMGASFFPHLPWSQSTFNHVLFLMGALLSCVCACVETEGHASRFYKSRNNIEHLLCAGIYLGMLNVLFYIMPIINLWNKLILEMGKQGSEIPWESGRARVGTYIFLIPEPVISLPQCHTNRNWQNQERKAY